MFLEHSALAWVGFNALVILLIALDLGIFHRMRREIPLREAAVTTGCYVILALVFDAWIYYQNGPQKGLEFLTGYFIEYALSMDNIMVFVVILGHFHVPPQYHMRVLIWGIVGALILRAIFIFAGVALINEFEWIVVLLGAFLVYTGFRTLLSGDAPPDLENNRVVKYARRLLPLTPSFHGEKFFVRSPAGAWCATPLFLVLVVLNVTDIVFAVDSIPAVFAITRDPFIVYTSNVFAILGLRALYFVLSGMLDKFKHLKTGLSLTLIFVGFKMVYNYPDAFPDIPTHWALAITAALIFGSIALSVFDEKSGSKGGPGVSIP